MVATACGNASVISSDIALRLSGTFRVSVAMCPSSETSTGPSVIFSFRLLHAARSAVGASVTGVGDRARTHRR